MTGQADVRWIWMAVALVVIAVPLLTLLVNREIRALSDRVAGLERRLAEAQRERAASPVVPAAGDLAAAQRQQMLDVLRTLSAMRPAEPEFVEEYYVEPPGRAAGDAA